MSPRCKFCGVDWNSQIIPAALGINSLSFVSPSAVDDIDIESSLPFYIQYYILMALHTQMAQTALGIYQRYHRLNMAVKDMFSLSKFHSFKFTFQFQIAFLFVSFISNLLPTANKSHSKRRKQRQNSRSNEHRQRDW